jgi:hypothetical protein
MEDSQDSHSMNLLKRFVSIYPQAIPNPDSQREHSPHEE